MSVQRTRTPLVLCILDGVGWRVGEGSEHGNAIAAAKPEFWPRLLADYPHTTLACKGLAVGLPEGQMGNSEVGHLNIGAGRPVLQDLPRIDAEIADGSFARNEVLLAAVKQVADARSRLPEHLPDRGTGPFCATTCPPCRRSRLWMMTNGWR